MKEKGRGRSDCSRISLYFSNVLLSSPSLSVSSFSATFTLWLAMQPTRGFSLLFTPCFPVELPFFPSRRPLLGWDHPAVTFSHRREGSRPPFLKRSERRQCLLSLPQNRLQNPSSSPPHFYPIEGRRRKGAILHCVANLDQFA